MGGGTSGVKQFQSHTYTYVEMKNKSSKAVYQLTVIQFKQSDKVDPEEMLSVSCCFLQHKFLLRLVRGFHTRNS